MRLDTKLDVDVLALDQEDSVTCLLTFQAPVPPKVADRPGETLVIVVDRSESMAGEPLAAVRSSLHALVDRVRPQDTLGIVTFDDSAAIAVPARPIRDHHLPTVHALIEGITPGRMTDLSGGYLLGLSEARRNLGATGATILLLSDGQANAGITDVAQLGGLASAARDERITSSTIGIGAGYDDLLLDELATRGNGSHRFALTPDDAAAVVGEEAGDLLSKAIVNAFVRVRPDDPALLGRISTLHAVPSWIEAGGDGGDVLVIPLGDLFAGEQRELLVHFDVPAVAALGPRQLAEFVLDYVELPELVARTVRWPLTVNVVPGDEAAGRVPDPTVTTAKLLAETTRSKKDAAEALRRGDSAQAARLVSEQADRLGAVIAGMAGAGPESTSLRRRLTEEQAQLSKLAQGAQAMPAPMAVKSFVEDYSMNVRGRNDQPRRDRARSKRDF